MIASDASTAGIGGIVVRPAPSPVPRSRVEEVPSRRVTLEPERVRADPNAVEDNRLDALDIVETLLPTPAGWVAAETSAPDAGPASGAVRLESAPLEVVLLEPVLVEDVPDPPGDPQMSQ